ncbi:MAG: hypothetical protein ACOCRX_10510 [Candidatus Woesearchaeota archaeon]
MNDIKKAPKFNSIEDLEEELKKIKSLDFNNYSKENVYQYNLLIHGVLNRTYELVDSSIWSIKNKRPLSSAMFLRGLIETLAFTHHTWLHICIKQDKEKIEKLLLGSRNKKTPIKSINILTCIDKAIDNSSEKFPNLRKNYDDLSEMIHPNSMSFFYSARAVNESNNVDDFKLPFYYFRDKDKEKVMNQVGEYSYYIRNFCQKTIDKMEKELE